MPAYISTRHCAHALIIEDTPHVGSEPKLPVITSESAGAIQQARPAAHCVVKPRTSSPFLERYLRGEWWSSIDILFKLVGVVVLSTCRSAGGYEQLEGNVTYPTISNNGIQKPPIRLGKRWYLLAYHSSLIIGEQTHNLFV